VVEQEPLEEAMVVGIRRMSLAQHMQVELQHLMGVGGVVLQLVIALLGV